jgi:CsoR family transcriptional regulator, copper-sensing transcriptional repressor
MRKDIKASCQKRLSRIEGQVRGLSKMVEEERYCIDIVTQISAVRAALRRVEEEVLKDHGPIASNMPIASGDKVDHRKKIAELMAVIGRAERWTAAVVPPWLLSCSRVSSIARPVVIERAMMAKQQIMRILGAAIVLIVLSFAPSVVQAHTGHEHHAAAQAAVQGGHGQAASQESGQAGAPASLQQAQLGQTEMPAPSSRDCVGGCCSFACASCCAAGLPSSVELVPLPRTVMRVSFPSSQARASRAPDSLRRPPKRFT